MRVRWAPHSTLDFLSKFLQGTHPVPSRSLLSETSFHVNNEQHLHQIWKTNGGLAPGSSPHTNVADKNELL